ncbi:MAG TPA: hypothetical protein VFY06_01600 [Verrucomicrobiae bacterium]|nr:hypothetical protein [Verrucomicrobiae bacterium]
MEPRYLGGYEADGTRQRLGVRQLSALFVCQPARKRQQPSR